MFEFITISNGVAVVQHAPSGYVYRFRPVHPGVWSTLTLDKVDAADPLGTCPDDHLGAAQAFAEEAASTICPEVSDIQVATPASWTEHWSVAGRLRRLALS